MTVVKNATVTGFFCCLLAMPAAADPALERVVDMARTSTVIPGDVIETAAVACRTALCFAEHLAKALPERIHLEPVTHPDTDSIRRAYTAPSVITDHTGDTLKLTLTHFGRKAVPELRAALAGAGRRLVVDLRGNSGGDFERMLDIAGLLLGPRRNAVEIDYTGYIERRSLDGQTTLPWRITRVETDEKTASAALLLAQLLETHTDAEMAGSPIQVKPVFLKRRIPVDHDWRLILPVAKVRVASR